ncbi:MAG: tRNA uridine-5-carboxymethylaminomethyl(34) synthesis GTPase MnmE [Oscillospiraceae bacterium]
MSNTITAITTPVIISAVGVVRMSGDLCYDIINKIFKPINNRDIINAKGYTAAYGHILYNGEIIDEVVVNFFRAPLSYTGEDVIEISCHGGVYLVKKVLDVVIMSGATLAMPGEFTIRAVLNGKMSLTQAEAVIDLINARDKQAAKIAMDMRNGVLFKSIDQVKKDVLDILSHLAAFIDYPEEEIEEVHRSDLLSKMVIILEKISKISKTSHLGTIVKEGVDTVIVGKTNVGKSSLMNMLSKETKSIVTDVEGTTRDIVQNTIKLQNVILNLNDTAGIRDTVDKVEEIGTSLSIKKIKTSTLVLVVFDASRKLDKNDYKIIDEIDNDNKIAIINKVDKEQIINIDEVNKVFKHIVFTSACNNQGYLELEKEIEHILNINNVDISMGVISNERQKHAINKAKEMCGNAIFDIENGQPLDLIVFNLEEVTEKLMEITGENVKEEMVKGLFSKFCVGK